MRRAALSVAAAGLAVLAVSAGGAAFADIPGAGCQSNRVSGYFPGDDRDPLWSPDGGRLLLNRNWPGQHCLAVLDVQTRAVHAVNGGVRYTSSPYVEHAWSPDGSQIAFKGETPSPRLHRAGVFLADASGRGRPRRLTHGRVQGLRWSRDRSALVWSGSGPGGRSRDHIWVLPLGADHPRRLTGGPREDVQPSWSPDGRSIVFVRRFDRPAPRRAPIYGDLYLVSARDRRLTRLTYGAAAWSPAWSPDGSLIAFVDAAGGISLVTTSGRLLRRLGNQSAELPTWSPDGTKLAFLARYHPVVAAAEVRIVGRDGRGERAGTRMLRSWRRFGNDMGVSWSPDGRWLVFEYHGQDRSPRNGIYIVRSDGTGLRQLTRVP
jgi:Tol biopolymer transport system component